MAEIINKNPFRILGVTANASPRDIVTNQNKMKAFMKVNKSVSFPLDLSDLLGVPERTPETVTAADTTLTIKGDRLRAALFWWINGNTAFDQTALRHVEACALDSALGLWEKQENMSSLANSALVHLIKGNHRPAAIAMSKMIENHASEFVLAVDVPGTGQAELIETYINTLMKEWPSVDPHLIIGDGFSETWNKTTRAAIIEPIIQQLESALQKARLTKDKDYKTRYRAGEILDSDTASLLKQLRKVVKINDVQLVSISDKIANEILQCSIDFYNAVDDVDFAEDTLKLLRRAKVIALGSMTKERIKENEAIMKNILESLPPKAVRAENDELNEIYNEIEGYAKTAGTVNVLLNRVRPVLKRIEQKLPPNDQTFAINRSSLIVNYALSILVEYVNAVQNAITQTNDVDTFKSLRQSVYDAKDMTEELTTFKVDSDTADRVNQNLVTIREICQQLSEVKTGDSFSEKISGCWIYIIIMVLLALFSNC